MISFIAFLAFIVHILDIPNNNVEEPAPSPAGSLPLSSPPAGSSLPLILLTPPPPPQLGLPPPSPPPPTGSTTSSQPDLPRRQRSIPFLDVAPPRRRRDHEPDSHQMDTLSWTALVYCFTAGLEFNAILAQVKDPSNVTIRVQLLSVLLSISLHLLIAANAIFARTHPNMAYVMDRVGSLTVLISSTIAAMPTVPEYVSVVCAVFMILLYAHQRFFS